MHHIMTLHTHTQNHQLHNDITHTHTHTQNHAPLDDITHTQNHAPHDDITHTHTVMHRIVTFWSMLEHICDSFLI